MIDNIGEFFTELHTKNELKIFPSLLLLDLPRESDLKKGNFVKSINSNQFYVFATTLISDGNLEIKKNTKFDVLCSRKRPIDFVECDVVLKYINVNPRYEIDYLPGGYTGICLIEFKNGKPEILNKLAFFGEKKEYGKNDRLILTQKELLNKLLNKIKEV